MSYPQRPAPPRQPATAAPLRAAPLPPPEPSQPKARKLSAEDAARLRKGIVSTPQGDFHVGRVKLPPTGLPCPRCQAEKAIERPYVDRGAWCSGCGWTGGLDELVTPEQG